MAHKINDVKLGEHWLSEYGGFLLEKPTYTSAQRDFELVSIPGRDGDIYLDNNRHKNVPFALKIGFKNRTKLPSWQQHQQILEWLNSLKGYQTYIETARVGQYTKAVITEVGQLVVRSRNLSSITLKLNREPYWYDLDGKNEIPIRSGSITLINPTLETARPIYLVRTVANYTYSDIVIMLDGTAYSYSNVYVSPNGYNLFKVNCVTGEVMKINEAQQTYMSLDAPIPRNLGKQTTITIKAYSSGSEVGALASVIPNWRRL